MVPLLELWGMWSTLSIFVRNISNDKKNKNRIKSEVGVGIITKTMRKRLQEGLKNVFMDIVEISKYVRTEMRSCNII